MQGKSFLDEIMLVLYLINFPTLFSGMKRPLLIRSRAMIRLLARRKVRELRKWQNGSWKQK